MRPVILQSGAGFLAPVATSDRQRQAFARLDDGFSSPRARCESRIVRNLDEGT
jgi:hypothetical protein